MSISIKLFDYKVLNEKLSKSQHEASDNQSDDDDDTKKKNKDQKEFIIQAFGLSKTGKSYCLYIKNVFPFFYIKVSDNWTQATKDNFLIYILNEIHPFYKDSILECKLVKRKTLYGFDAGKLHKFIYLKFKNVIVFNKVKNLWYETKEINGENVYTIKTLSYNKCETEIYESTIPPLLRFFHVTNISPSHWIKIPYKQLAKPLHKTTTCNYEYIVDKQFIIPQPEKNDLVPYKICSFDIEASSSHGDFPLPIKDYKKLIDNIIEHWHYKNISETHTIEDQEYLLKKIINDAFENGEIEYIQKIYPKKKPEYKELQVMINKLVKKPIRNLNFENNSSNQNKIFDYYQQNENTDETENNNYSYKKYKSYVKKDSTIIDLLNDRKFNRDDKLNEINKTFKLIFPEIKGDKVTFIGSTFWKFGEPDVYLNHCIALGETSSISNAKIISKKTEKDVLLTWGKLIQKESPDIIIGYNIFGFDYAFMFDRACELGIAKDFLKLSRTKDEVCGNYNEKTNTYIIKETTLQIASGAHKLRYVEIPGRISIDLYNYFRREFNLESYKLDYVAGCFIGDSIKSFQHEESTSTIVSKNLKGLHIGNFINFEETGHSSEFYNDGEKFQVVAIHGNTITIKGNPQLDMIKKTKWCLAKDDVTPQDIFRLTKTGIPDDKAIIAKYCIQDCNLVHYLLNKIDVLTGFVEMSNICNVPISFIVFRGQGIKLTSFLSKRCREMNTLIPDLSKLRTNEGYEGAIVLPPKCGLYLDEPVACVDYSSLYPSSIISENISHDSKVWGKEYDLNNNLIKETGSSKYDNLENYKYVDIQYDTYKYIKNKNGKDIKTKVGYKTCRFAQFPENTKAIIPSILEDLLAARKATRKLIKYKTIKTKDNEIIEGLLTEKEETYEILTSEKKNIIIQKDNIVSIEDTYDDFMKNVFDKRQQGYKVTANSMYGQCGAKTSSFYEVDVAASTTAIGRKLLIYARKIIEQIYGDKICKTSYGTVHSHAEYIYGDTDSVFMSFKLTDLEGTPIKGKEALKITIELAKEAGELATKFLKPPHDLEYEKTFMPFCLLSKKRYVGMLYEEDPEVCKRKSMGIVLKRRDNAPIVKDVYGGIIDILMKEQNIMNAINFTKSALENIYNENYPLHKLIITKSLRSNYKAPEQIAHKVLANRMGIRDPGNKPGPGDRIPYVYIETQGKVKLQGDRIENPVYIIENKIKPNYSFYITNQIMKPVQQVFALVLEDIPIFKRQVRMFKNKLKILNQTCETDEQYEKKEMDLRNKEIKKLIFDDILLKINNKKEKKQEITRFFK
uniref:DNA-directed DNA polymerase n=1 Tax=viral metagenome TaxID=1070528 RepID=A0A6C0KIS8_9ZZZZ